ncbi:MAG: hypothetical protein ACXVNR_07570 [Bacteroidia bacterium]
MSKKNNTIEIEKCANGYLVTFSAPNFLQNVGIKLLEKGIKFTKQEFDPETIEGELRSVLSEIKDGEKSLIAADKKSVMEILEAAEEFFSQTNIPLQSN